MTGSDPQNPLKTVITRVYPRLAHASEVTMANIKSNAASTVLDSSVGMKPSDWQKHTRSDFDR